VKGVASKGVRLGNWLSVQQAQRLLNAPDVSAPKGLRDRAILAVLLGCGLRRSEVAALTMGYVQQRDGRWCIVDLVGKHGRVRTVPMPAWAKVAIDAWTSLAGLADGHVFRAVNRGGTSSGSGPEREGRLAIASGICGRCGSSGNCALRFEARLRENVPGGRRRTGADSVAPRPRVRTDHRAVPRDQAGPGARAE
jgi:integrase